MDENHLHFIVGLTPFPEGLNNVVNAAPCVNDYAIPYLSSGSSGGTRPDFPNRYKRKGEIEDGASLALGLGNSSTSCITTSSGRETRDEYFGELELKIDFLGNDMASNLKKFSYEKENAFEVRRPYIDLELSLSTAPAESGITISSMKESSPHETGLVPPSYLVGQLVDEGSTSSRWKPGPLFSTAPGSENITIAKQHVDPTYNILATSSISNSLVKTTEGLVAFSSAPVHEGQRRANVKICSYEGCTRGARGASGLCIAHGGGRRCQRLGCPKGAEGKTVFCKAHGGGRRCQSLGCTKSAEGRTEYCIGHGGGRRCSNEDCSRAARGKSGLCIRHGGGKRCKVENCTKSAEGVTSLCISHGGGRRCQYPDCTKGAQGSTVFCKAHGGGRRCTYLGCTKGAEGSTPFCKGHGGGKRCTSEGCTKSVHGGTLFCVSHGGGKRCGSPGCTKSARGRTDFCVRHGGGKRCKIDGCTKSAQGSTDFCKAHGGGKRCSWGQLGYDFAGQDAMPCDKFARGKSGLCASHAAVMQLKPAHGGSAESPILHDVQYSAVNNMKDVSCPGDNNSMPIGFRNYGREVCSSDMPRLGDFTLGSTRWNEFSLPEGRVHGGSLMAMLRGSKSQTGNSGAGGPFEN